MLPVTHHTHYFQDDFGKGCFPKRRVLGIKRSSWGLSLRSLISSTWPCPLACSFILCAFLFLILLTRYLWTGRWGSHQWWGDIRQRRHRRDTIMEEWIGRGWRLKTHRHRQVLLVVGGVDSAHTSNSPMSHSPVEGSTQCSSPCVRKWRWWLRIMADRQGWRWVTVVRTYLS